MKKIILILILIAFVGLSATGGDLKDTTWSVVWKNALIVKNSGFTGLTSTLTDLTDGNGNLSKILISAGDEQANEVALQFDTLHKLSFRADDIYIHSNTVNDLTISVPADINLSAPTLFGVKAASSTFSGTGLFSGNLTLTSDLDIDGNDITSAGDLLITPGGTEVHINGGLDIGGTSAVGDNNLNVVGNATISGTTTVATADINSGAIDGTTIGVSSASSGDFTTVSASGVVDFADGAVGTPSMTNTGDLTTGLFFNDAGKMQFTSEGNGQITLEDGAILPVLTDIDLGSAADDFQSAWFSGTMTAGIVSGEGYTVKGDITASSITIDIDIKDGEAEAVSFDSATETGMIVLDTSTPKVTMAYELELAGILDTGAGGVVLDGPVNSSSAKHEWTLVNNSTDAIEFKSSGKDDILNINSTTGSEGISTSGDFDIDGSIAFQTENTQSLLLNGGLLGLDNTGTSGFQSGTDGKFNVKVAGDTEFTFTTNALEADSGSAIDSYVLKVGGLMYLDQTHESKSGNGAISIATQTTLLTSTGANTNELADGTNGQIKIISYIVDGGSSVLTPANFGQGTTITFTTVGDACELIFLGTSWYIRSISGATIAP